MSDFKLCALERVKDNTEKFYNDLQALDKDTILHDDDTALLEDLHFIALLHIPCMQTKRVNKLVRTIIEIDEDGCLTYMSQYRSALHYLHMFIGFLAKHVPAEY